MPAIGERAVAGTRAQLTPTRVWVGWADASVSIEERAIRFMRHAIGAPKCPAHPTAPAP